MTVNQNQKSRHVMRYGLIFLLAFLTLIFVQTVYIYFHLWQYEKVKFTSEKTELNLIISDAQTVATVLYDLVINKPKVIEVFKQANSSNIAIKNHAREDLYALLKDDYQLFTQHGIQQLHFHLPNNDSFLRFHKPNKYGDNLAGVRASVEYVNREKKFTYGFEEGRIFNGYRFVYPLFESSGKYLGSVEVSLSLLAFKEAYESANRHIDFILKKSVVEKKVFKDQLFNYQLSPLSDQFYIQKTLADFNDSDPYEHAAIQQKIYQQLGQDQGFLDDLESLEQALAIKWIDFEPYSIKFMPLLNDFTQRVVGYSVLFSKSDYFSVYWRFHVAVALVIMITSLIFSVVLFFNQRIAIANNRSEKLAELNQQIQNANTLLDSVINGTTDKIFYKDKDFNYLGANHSYIQALQQTQGGLIGKNDFDLYPHEVAQAFRDDDRKVLQNGKSMSIFESVTFPSGETGYFNTQKIPFIYDEHQPPGILGVARDITDLHSAQLKLEELSHTDELTGLFNRKAYNERMVEEIAKLKRYQTPFSLIMFDIDDFKAVNDEHGHDVGDQVLIAISKMLKRTTRENDSVFRIGGEEFVVILPNTSIADAVNVAEKLRESVEKLQMDGVPKVTISLGVTGAHMEDCERTLFKRVDDLLYQAKTSGKNCVMNEHGCAVLS